MRPMESGEQDAYPCQEGYEHFYVSDLGDCHLPHSRMARRKPRRLTTFSIGRTALPGETLYSV